MAARRSPFYLILAVIGVVSSCGNGAPKSAGEADVRSTNPIVRFLCRNADYAEALKDAEPVPAEPDEIRSLPPGEPGSSKLAGQTVAIVRPSTCKRLKILGRLGGRFYPGGFRLERGDVPVVFAELPGAPPRKGWIALVNITDSFDADIDAGVDRQVLRLHVIEPTLPGRGLTDLAFGAYRPPQEGDACPPGPSQFGFGEVPAQELSSELDVRNAGKGPTPRTIRWSYRVGRTRPVFETEVLTRPLARGETHALLLPTSTRADTLVVLDPAGAVRELNERNNRRTLPPIPRFTCVGSGTSP